ncbi:hypothetical protein [Xanthomonas hawaiiensis]|nr:hypothetical protein [Xanthomonas sp. A6251]WNH45556.1 hypothetical protein PG878_03550 [Xanthomonas sp. A6251]
MAVISGCATNQKKAAPEKNEASVRFYPGKTSAELKVAAAKEFTALSPGQMRVEVLENEVRARYSYSYMARGIGYVGNTTSFSGVRADGATWYTVTVQQQAGGTLAQFTYLNAEPAGVFHPGFKSNLPVRAEDSIEGFKLFHDRLEYLVGIRKEWTPCPSSPVGEREFIEICDRRGLHSSAL